MRTLFVGDVHGCADELMMLLTITKPTRTILLGDIFTKGPLPEQVWELIQKHSMESVCGNHDELLLRRKKKKKIIPKAARKWLSHLPIFIQGPTWIAVHGGLNPKGPTLKQEALYMRKWPMQREKKRFWWKKYKGEKLVLYGHDAKRQLQDHRPHTLGLDSGCVYGFQLTGYLLEEDTLYHVPAKEVYCPI